MSSTFDTIIIKGPIEILENKLPQEEIRIARLPLSNTSLDMKTKGIETEGFQSNKRSPQGDRISRIFFNIYLEDSLRHAH